MTTSIVIAKPDTESLAEQAGKLSERALSLVVADVDSHRVALEVIRELRAREKAVAEHFEPSRAALDKAKKELLAARDSLVKPMEEARRTLGGKCDLFEVEQRRASVYEQQKLEAEERARQEQLRLEEAVLAEEAGQAEEAEKIMEAPIEVSVATVAPQVAAVAGISNRTVWSAEVFDFAELLVWVLKDPARQRYVDPNQTHLNRDAITLHEEMKIPGVKAISKTIRAIR